MKINVRNGGAVPQGRTINVLAAYKERPRSFKYKEEISMPAKNANIDYCGIRNLLRLLSGQGFTEAELKKIAARIAQATGATIIFC